MKKIFFSLGLVIASTFLLTGCLGEQPVETEVTEVTPVELPPVEETTMVYPKENLVEVAKAAGSFNTLLTAVEAAGLSEVLASSEFTLFAPTDEAFAKLPEGSLEKLLADPEALTNVLKYHLLDGRVMANEVALLTAATTLNGDDLTIGVSDSGIKVNDANVARIDILASNGVIHVIDSVLLPEEN